MENDVNAGVLVLRLEFTPVVGELGSEEPRKLVCFGSLPNKANQVLKVFEGRDCPVQFALWLLSNMLDYKLDSRIDPS